MIVTMAKALGVLWHPRDSEERLWALMAFVVGLGVGLAADMNF